MPYPPDGDAENVQSQKRGRCAFQQRRLGASGERHTGDTKADRLVRGVAKEVERISLQGA